MNAPDLAAQLRAALNAAEQTAKAVKDERYPDEQGWFTAAAKQARFVLRHIAAAKKILDAIGPTLNDHKNCGNGVEPSQHRVALATLTALAAAWQPAQQETP